MDGQFMKNEWMERNRNRMDAKLMEHVWQLKTDGTCMETGWGIHGKLLENGPRREMKGHG